jgi:hypothetical protein
MSAALTRAAMKMGSAIAGHGVFMISRICDLFSEQ